MSTATAPVLKSVEVFKDSVPLFRVDYATSPGPQCFVVVCPDGTVLWGQRLPEAFDRNGEAITLPEIVADKVAVTHTGGMVDELICKTTGTEREEHG